MIIPTGYAQANLLFTGLAAPRGAQIELGVALDVGMSNPLAIGAAIYDAWEANLLPLQSTSITLSGCRVKVGPNASGPDGTYVESDAGGNTSSPAMPPQVALLAKKNTDLGGRAHKGRMFIPGAIENAADASGAVSDATIAAYNTALAAFLVAVAASPSPTGLVLLHTDPLVAPTPIVSITLTALVASQRRRVRKVGGRRAIV